MFANEIDLIILDSFGNPAGYLLPCGKSKLIERYEIQSRITSSRALLIAKAMCIASVNNKITLLRSIQKNTGVDVETRIESMRRMTGKAESCEEATSLQGFEGFSTNEYYSALMKILPAEFNFTGRNRNPPMDPFNSLLGYGYGILYSRIRSAIVKSGLSPYYGVFHATYRTQEALVYDLIEEFRQPVVDRAVLTLIARKQVSPTDFNVTNEGCFFKNSFKKKFAGIILGRLDQEYTYGNEKKTFSEIIETQADRLASAIFETGKYSPFTYM